MSESSPFLSLLLITGLAAFVPLLASRLRRLRVPTVVGEILAGMMIGKSGLNLVESSPTLDFLALFGFSYLMLLSGLEVDFVALSADTEDSNSRSRLRRSVLLGSLVFLLSLVISYSFASVLLFLDLISDPLMMALILSTTSLGIVVPVLKERALIATDLGQTILFSALTADFGTLLLITVDVAILGHGPTPEVLFILLFLVVFAFLFRMAKAAAGISSLRRVFDELAHATAQIHVRGAVALMVAFIVLSEWLGIEVILGAFLAGVLISLLSRRDRTQFLRLKMDAIGFGFFIPIFFIMVGVRFDLAAIAQSPRTLALVPLLLVASYAIKVLATLPYRAFFPWRETLAAGVLLSSRLSLIIAAAAIASELGILDDAANSAVILVAIVTCTVSPLLFNRVLPPRNSQGGRKGIILVGLGEIPVLLAERLHSSGKDVTLVGTDQAQIRRLLKRKLKVVKGDPALLRTPRSAGADTALALEGALYFPAVFDILADPADGMEITEIPLRNSALAGELLRNVRLPGDALVMGLRHKKEILVPRGDTKLRLGDLVMLAGKQDSLKRAIARLSTPDR